MENTEVINVEEIEVLDPVIKEVSETTKDNSVGAAGGFVAGVIAVAGAVALWKFVIKPYTKNIKAKIEEKKYTRMLHNERQIDATENITTVDFEEVENSDNE